LASSSDRQGFAYTVSSNCSWELKGGKGRPVRPCFTPLLASSSRRIPTMGSKRLCTFLIPIFSLWLHQRTPRMECDASWWN
jgi:hypothetical protein